MIESLVSAVGQRGVDAAAFLLAFALTALTDSLFHNKLPHDHGRDHDLLQNGRDAQGQHDLGRLLQRYLLALPHFGRELFKGNGHGFLLTGQKNG